MNRGFLSGKTLALFIPAISISLWSCGLVKDLRKTSDEIDKTFKTINTGGKDLHDMVYITSNGAVSGAVEALTRDSVKLKEISSKILESIKRESGGIVASIRDSILNKKTTAWLEGAFRHLSDSAQHSVLQLINDPRLLLGTRKIIAGIRDEILGDATIKRIGNLRDSTFGARARILTDSLIHHAMMQLIRDYDVFEPRIDTLVANALRLEKKIKDDSDDLIKGIAWTLGVLLTIALLGIYLIKRTAAKHKETIQAMALAIDSLSPAQFDAIAPAIKNKALEKGVNAHLNKILNDTKLPNRSIYKDERGETLDQLLKKLNKQSPVIQQIKQDAGVHNAVKDFLDKNLPN